MSKIIYGFKIGRYSVQAEENTDDKGGYNIYYKKENERDIIAWTLKRTDAVSFVKMLAQEAAEEATKIELRKIMSTFGEDANDQQ